MMTKGTDYTVEKKEEIRRLSKVGEPITMYRIWATSKGGNRPMWYSPERLKP